MIKAFFAIPYLYWLRHGSAESASDKAVIKFGILVGLHFNPGYKIRFSGGSGKCRKKWVEQNIQVAMPFDYPLTANEDDSLPTRSRSRSVLPTLFTNKASSGSAWRYRLKISRFPQRLSMTIFKRARRFHQVREQPSH